MTTVVVSLADAPNAIASSATPGATTITLSIDHAMARAKVGAPGNAARIAASSAAAASATAPLASIVGSSAIVCVGSEPIVTVSSNVRFANVSGAFNATEAITVSGVAWSGASPSRRTVVASPSAGPSDTPAPTSDTPATRPDAGMPPLASTSSTDRPTAMSRRPMAVPGLATPFSIVRPTSITDQPARRPETTTSFDASTSAWTYGQNRNSGPINSWMTTSRMSFPVGTRLTSVCPASGARSSCVTVPLCATTMFVVVIPALFVVVIAALRVTCFSLTAVTLKGIAVAPAAVARMTEPGFKPG